jgi:hypothetical protein
VAVQAGSVFVNLGAKLDRREFDLYERELKKVQEKTAKKDAFKAELGGKFDNRAFNAYQRELQKTEHAVNDNVKAQGRLRTSFGALYGKGGAMFAAAGGLAAVTLGLRSVIKASGDAEATTAKVKKMVENAGFSWAAHAKEIDKVIQAHSRLSGFDDEDLAESFANMIRTTGSLSDAMKLNNIVMDVARAKGTDLAGAQSLVARVYNGSFTGLKRLGVAITPVTEAQDKLKESTKKYSIEQMRAAKEQDKIATRNEAIAKLQKTFAGQAEAYGKTQRGSIERLGVAWENLQETIGARLAPTITRASNSLSKFIDEMSAGTGTGGDFVKVLKGIGDTFSWLFKMTKHAVDGMLGFFSTLVRGEGAMAGLLGKLHPGNDAMDRFAKHAKIAADRIDNFRERLRPSLPTVQDLSDRIDKSNYSLKGFHDQVERMRFNKLQDRVQSLNQTLASDKGTKAAGRNFRSLRNTIADNINDAVDATHHGMSSIQVSLMRELKNLGVANVKEFGGLTVAGTNKPLPGLPPAVRQPLPKAGGGWIGAPGLIGDDIVPAMLAPGEAVLNRHQQAIIEGLLGGGFLDRLFASVQRPHYMATGGMVAAANRLDSARFPYRWGGGHQASPAPFGPMDCSGAVSYVLQQGGVGIPTMTSGMLMNAGAQGGGQVTVFANPSHTFKRIGQRYFGTSGTNPGGGAGWFPAPAPGYLSRFTQRHFMGGRDISLSDIKAPTVGGSGALRAITQAALGLAARAANSAASRVGLGTGDVGDAGPGHGGTFSFGALRSLWTGVGGAARRSAIMAHIAEAESGGDPAAKNPSGASGLWQILGLPFAGDPFDPATNARMAKAKSSNGVNLNPWNASRSVWGQFANRGGFIQSFATGGRAGSKRKKIKKPSAASKARDYIRPLASLQTDRVADWDIIQGKVDDANTHYSLAERTYDLDVEELIKPDGTIDEGAIRERGNELLGLISIRERIIDQLGSARRVAARIIKTYSTIIARLKRSLKHAGKKSRASIRETIGTYSERRDEWTGKLHELNVSTLPSARLDLRELVRERGEVLGTKAEPGDVPDTGAADLGSGGGDTSAVAAPPTPADIAAAAIQDFSSYLTGASDLYKSYGANFVTANRASSMFSNPDAGTAMAGARFFGATGGGAGLGGATIINNYNQLPDNTQTWSSQMRFQLEAA